MCARLCDWLFACLLDLGLIIYVFVCLRVVLVRVYCAFCVFVCLCVWPCVYCTYACLVDVSAVRFFVWLIDCMLDCLLGM